MMNEMKKMKTLTLQGIPFEVVDEAARNDIESVKDTLENLPKNEIVTPDLAQNDPTAPDYVKNRTHYEEYAEKTVEVAEEALLEGFPAFEVGDTVTLKVDGTEYSLVAFDDYGFAVIGDALADLEGGTGEFGWLAYCEDSEVWFFSPSSNHTVGFTGVTVHKLDVKYLPDLASVAFSGEYEDLENRPWFYQDVTISIGDSRENIKQMFAPVKQHGAPIVVYFDDNENNHYKFIAEDCRDIYIDSGDFEITHLLMVRKNGTRCCQLMDRLMVKFDENDNVSSGSRIMYPWEIYLSADTMNSKVFKITVDYNGNLNAEALPNQNNTPPV